MQQKHPLISNKIANILPRGIAAAIDLLIALGSGAFLLLVVFLTEESVHEPLWNFLFFMAWILPLIVDYFNSVSYASNNNGKSIGKGLMRVVVVDKYGKPLSKGKMFLRRATIWFEFAFAGAPFLIMLFPMHQGFHDMIYDSYVIENG